MSTIDRPFVVGVAGAPGAGKTTLTQALARKRAARVVYYDRYQPLTRLPFDEIRAWFARGGDSNEIDHHEILADLARETTPGGAPLVLFETPFGRLHRASGAYIDYLIWIDAPLDLALSRAMLAFTRAARADPAAGRGFLDWQMQYLSNYPLVREMYVSQRAQCLPAADLVLDGAKSVEVWLRTVLPQMDLRSGEARRDGANPPRRD